MQVFRSKIDLWFMLLCAAMLVGPILLGLLDGDPGQMRTVWVISAMIAAFLFWLVTATKYQMSDRELTVHNGLYKIRIPLETIQNVTPSRSLLASPALSLDRLDIAYGAGKNLLVSPKDKPAFLAAIGQA